MRIGYARVSTHDQNLNLQIDALKAQPCEKIFKKKVSGVKSDRPELTKLLEQLREDDILVIWKLDRLGRSLRHLIELVDELDQRGVGLISMQDPINTTTPQGQFGFRIFASLVEFEREMIKERTKAGLQSVRHRGQKLGRPEGLSKDAEDKSRIAESLYKEGALSTQKIAKQLGISKNYTVQLS